MRMGGKTDKRWRQNGTRAGRCWTWLLTGLLLSSACAAGTHGAETRGADLSVTGSISNQAPGTQCVLQLHKPIWPVAGDKEVSGHFSTRFVNVPSDELFILSLTCDGYEAYASHPMKLDHGDDAIDIGLVDARTRLDPDGCRELIGPEAERVSKELVARFLAETHLPISTMRFSRPRACPKATSLFAESQAPGAGPWGNWLVTKHRADGRIDVEKGF